MMELNSIKGEVIGKSHDLLPTVGNIGPDFQVLFIKANELGLSLNGMRILGFLLLNLKEKQVKEKEKKQLDLFDEMLDMEKETDIGKTFNFKYSDFLLKGNKNYSMVKKGIEELKKIHLKIQITQDIKGVTKRFEVEAPIISATIMEVDGYGFKMLINKYWYRAMINLTHRFNPFLKSILYNVSVGSSLSFYFFLKNFQYIEPKNKDIFIESGLASAQRWRVKGMRKNLEDFKELLGLKYKYPSDLKRKFLDPMRAELNKIGDISFNYRLEKDNIILVQYPVNRVLIAENIESDDTNEIKNAIIYKIKNQKLNEIEVVYVIELYLKYTYDIFKKATSKKRELRGVTGKVYIEKAQILIEKYIKNNNINLTNIEYKNKGEIRKALRTALKI